VQDWPWGYKLRTEKRFWIESNKNGDRTISQTLDPRTGKWCAPKKSIYYPVKIFYTSDQNIVVTQGEEVEQLRCETIDRSNNERIKSFYERHKDNLNDFQKAQIKKYIGFNEAMEDVTFEFKPVYGLDKGKEIEENNQKIMGKIFARAEHISKTIEL
jgi:hypothetical protein